ncbi:MAG: hypothetical protein LIO46_02980, partial [Clostridiales bacterium]|nr:hypothetical protein [Clostridiales bacterium]
STLGRDNSGWIQLYPISYGQNALISNMKQQVDSRVNDGARWMYCYYDSSNEIFYVQYIL